MLDSGILLPDPHPSAEGLGTAVTVAVPVKDRPEELARCLAAIAADSPQVSILVIDDASADAGRVASVAERVGASVLRLRHPHGPAGARNAALRAVSTPLIAFVDSDVVVQQGWLTRLVADFADPSVAAAAPRVGALHQHGGTITEYEARHSGLDMGPRPGLVGAGRSIPYLPSAALVVRRGLVQDEFDPALTIGEDVDFVWRLADRGWRVLYDPAAVVLHDHRVEVLPFLRRRITYAWSIGLLARRHPQALPAVRVEPWSVLTLLMAGSGRRWGLVACAAPLAVRALRTRALLQKHTAHPTGLAAQLTYRGLTGTARGLGHAVRRAWSPLLVPLAWRSRRARFVLAASVLTAAVDEGVRPRHVPVKVLDDLLAALGTWGSCIQHRTVRPLLPARARQMASPPSTGSAAPVMPFASGPANQQMAAAISSGLSSRSSGC
jgi:mycofactocin system glycosyltransferase